MVVARKHKLMKELLVLETDGAIIRGFKKHLKVMLDCYFLLNEIHKMATLLNPKFKKIATKLLIEQDIIEALNNLNSMVDDLPLVRPVPTGEKGLTEPPAKHRSDDNISSFWRNKTEVYPSLLLVVRSILSIPATSKSSEQLFTIAGRTLDDQRTQLHPKCVDAFISTWFE